MTHVLSCRSKSLKPGFTLTELLITIAILGVLLAIAVPAYRNIAEGNKKNVTRDQIKILQNTIGLFELGVGKYPERLEDLVRRPVAGDYYDADMVADWVQGGYVEGGKLPKDGWKKKFIYKLTPDGPKPYELYSYGPKGKKAPRSEWIRAK